MTDRNDRHERAPERRPAEGVRIIGAEEAQKALDAGQAAGRRADDELRFGDVPPAPAGPRPPHRFPLPDSVDPAEAVPRPPVAPIRSDSPPAGRHARAEAPGRAAPDGASGRVVPNEAEGTDPAAPATEPAAAAPPTVVATPAAGDGTGVAVPLPLGEEDPTGPLPVAGPDPAPQPIAHREVGRPETAAPAWGDAPRPAARLRWAETAAGAADLAAPDRPVAAGPVEQLASGARGWEPGPDWAPRASSYDAAGYDADGYDAPGSDAAGYDPAGYEPAGYDADGSDAAGYDEAGSVPAGYEPAGSDPAGYDEAGYAAPAASAAGPTPSGAGADPTVALPASRPATSWNLGERSSPWSPPGDPDEEAWAGGADAEEEPVDDGRGRPASYGYDPAAYRAPTLDVSGYEPPAPDEVPDLAPPEEGITVTGATALPHWTEPAEGVPSSLLDPSMDSAGLDAWNALGTGGVRWRGEHEEWDEADDAAGFLAGDEDEVRVGALDTDRSDHSDLYSFDEAFQQLEEERSGAHPAVPFNDEEDPVIDDPVPATTGARGSGRRRGSDGRSGRAGATRTAEAPRAAPRRAPSRAPVGGRDDLGSRVAVGAGLVVVLLVAYLVGPKALLVLAAAVVLFCAAEAYGILQRCGFRPATLLGLAATAGLVFAAYWRGSPAIPLVLVITFAATMLWYLLGIVDARPLANVAVTSMTVLWVGLLGSFAALLLRAPDGKGLFLGTVITTVVADVVAYFVGKQVGHRPLAPTISPGKTVEGLAGGVVAAIIVGVVVGKAITPWGGIKHGLALGVVVAVVAPIGDLFESLIKRDLSVKDSGTTLAGHGGLLDRFDSLLLVLPASYYLSSYLHILR